MPSSWIALFIKKLHQNLLSSFKDLIIHDSQQVATLFYSMLCQMIILWCLVCYLSHPWMSLKATKGLTALAPEIDRSQTAIGLPPVMSTEFVSKFGKTWASQKKIWYASATLSGIKHEWYVCMYGQQHATLYIHHHHHHQPTTVHCWT
jgi:hypothetical protein